MERKRETLPILSSRRILMIKLGIIFGGFIVFPLLLFFVIAPTVGNSQQERALRAEREEGARVLAAEDSNSQFVFTISVPSVFKQAVTFLSNVDIKGNLTINDLAIFPGGISTNNADINLGTGNLTAGNIVYGITAGNGIEVTNDQQPTISNTGVLSLQGQTGEITLTAGDGITITGTTISNSSSDDSTSPPNTFNKIAVGADSFTAGSTTDTLTFEQGTGISLTLDTSNKKVTIGSTGGSGSGWVDGGTDVVLETITDVVGIGTASPSEKLDVVGNINISTGSTFKVNGVDVLSATTLGTSVVASSLTSVGTISTGVWNGTVITTTYGGTGLASYTQGDILYYSSGSTLSTLSIGGPGLCLVSSGSAPTWSSCSNASNFWNISSGALSPSISSLDLLVGGSTTSSAKFAIIGVGNARGNQVASLSGSIVLDSAASIQTTNNQTLTIGGNTTGNISFNPLNGSGQILFPMGSVTSPSISFADDPDTGIYHFPTSNNLSFATAGVEVMRLTATGRLVLGGMGDANTPIITTVNDNNTGLFWPTGADLFAITTAGVERIRFNHNGSLGIGITTLPQGFVHISGGVQVPYAALVVDQTGSSANDIFAASSSGVTRFVITNDGTASSSAGFTLNGAGTIQSTRGQTLTLGGGTTGNLIIGRTGQSLLLGSSTFANCSTLETINGMIGCGTDDTSSGGSTFWQYNSSTGIVANGNLTTDLLLGGVSTATAKIAFIGINTNTPSASISGNLNLLAPSGNGAATSLNLFNNSTFAVRQSPGGDAGLATRLSINQDGHLQIGPLSGNGLYNSSTNQISIETNGVERMRFSSSGRTLFAGTVTDITAPPLAVVNDTNTGIYWPAQNNFGFVSNSSELLRINTTGIGIANTSPLTSLHVDGRNSRGRAAVIIDQTASSSNDLLAASSSGTTRFIIKNDGTASSSAGFTIDGTGSIQSTRNQTLTIGGSTTGNILLSPLNGSGFVGIGTTNPGYKLSITDNRVSTVAALFENTDSGADSDVLALKLGASTVGAGNYFTAFLNGNGEIIGKVRGNGTGGVVFDTAGGDYAEWFKKSDPDEEFETGQIVCLTPDGVAKCDGGNGSVLGAISDTPGFVGNSGYEDDVNYVLVGLLGQVRVRVNDFGGMIKKSDFIAQSGQVGVGKKATEPGFVLGRALEDLDTVSSTSSILVAISPSYYADSLAMGDKISESYQNNTFQHQFPSQLKDVASRVEGVEGSLFANSRSISQLEKEISTLTAKLNTLDEFKKLTISPFASSESGFVTVAEDLLVFGTSSFGDVSIQEELRIGSTLKITRGGIDSIGEDLYLQSLRQGAVNFMDGAMVIDTDGEIFVYNDATFKKKVIIEDVLSAKTIRGIDNNLIVSGSARFETASFKNIHVENSSIKRISDDEIEAEGIAGRITLLKGQKSIRILNKSIKNNSLVFITPHTNLGSQNLFVSEQKENSSFTVSLEGEAAQNIEFTYLLLN